MSSLRRQLRHLSWVAFFAIFGLVVAPTVSHALAHAQDGTLWAEVCTPQGAKWVWLADVGDLGDADSPPAPVGGMDHCPLCGLAGSAPAVPPASVSLIVPAGPSHSLRARFQPALHPQSPWTAAQPRAPPAAP